MDKYLIPTKYITEVLDVRSIDYGSTIPFKNKEILRNGNEFFTYFKKSIIHRVSVEIVAVETCSISFTTAETPNDVFTLDSKFTQTYYSGFGEVLWVAFEILDRIPNINVIVIQPANAKLDRIYNLAKQNKKLLNKFQDIGFTLEPIDGIIVLTRNGVTLDIEPPKPKTKHQSINKRNTHVN